MPDVVSFPGSSGRARSTVRSQWDADGTRGTLSARSNLILLVANRKPQAAQTHRLSIDAGPAGCRFRRIKEGHDVIAPDCVQVAVTGVRSWPAVNPGGSVQTAPPLSLVVGSLQPKLTPPHLRATLVGDALVRHIAAERWRRLHRRCPAQLAPPQVKCPQRSFVRRTGSPSDLTFSVEPFGQLLTLGGFEPRFTARTASLLHDSTPLRRRSVWTRVQSGMARSTPGSTGAMEFERAAAKGASRPAPTTNHHDPTVGFGAVRIDDLEVHSGLQELSDASVLGTTSPPPAIAHLRTGDESPNVSTRPGQLHLRRVS